VIWPQQLQAVMDKALERDANDRYQTASEFGRALFQAVQGVRMSAATAAFTSVIQPPGAGKGAPAAIGKTAAEKPPAPVPMTRVSKSTPPSMLAQTSQKSRTPMIAAVAVVVVLLIGGGAYIAMARGADRNGAAVPQGDTTHPVDHSTPAVPAGADLSNAFEQIEPMTDVTRDANTQTATRALALLDSIAPAARTDSDRVHVALLKSEAHFVRSDDATAESEKQTEISVGCTILKDYEGKASRTRFKKRFDVFLHGDPSKGLPKTC
jgi:hypothetical protein